MVPTRCRQNLAKRPVDKLQGSLAVLGGGGEKADTLGEQSRAPPNWKSTRGPRSPGWATFPAGRGRVHSLKLTIPRRL